MENYCPSCFEKFPAELSECPKDGTNLVSFVDGDLTGRVLDKRYTVMERIGRGGMGIVYKAEQCLIKRIVALKVLRREVVQDESAVKRFLNEARATSSLQSPHTVTLHDFGVTSDGLLYYTMELLAGRPLSKVIKMEAPLSYKRAVDMVLQACDSLEEAHAHNILHRDIKPDNLFVTPVRGKENVKVLDFGIAKIVGDTSMDSFTKTGSIIGTPQYLSPEQAMGTPVVPASDLYSLAIVLYEMLTGSPPFQSDTTMKTLWKHAKEKPEPIFVRNPNIEVPKSVDLFLQKALMKDPERRFESAIAFRRALEAALATHDATPETVAVTALANTEEGVRVSAFVEETLEQVSGTPTENATVDAEKGGAFDETLNIDSVRAKSAALQEQQDTGHAPGQNTLDLVRPNRNRSIWIGAAIGAVVVIGGIGIWQPWVGGQKTDSPETGIAANTSNTDPERASPSGIGVPDVAEQEPQTSGKSQTDVSSQAASYVADVISGTPPAADVKSTPKSATADMKTAVPRETPGAGTTADLVSESGIEDVPAANEASEAEKAQQEHELAEKLTKEQEAQAKLAAEEKAKADLALQKAAELQASELKNAKQKAAELKAAELQAAEKKAAELKASEVTNAKQKASELKAAEKKAAEKKAAEKKAAEKKAAEKKAAEKKAAEKKAAEKQAADNDFEGMEIE
jgi:serine/threonine protein kinase